MSKQPSLLTSFILIVVMATIASITASELSLAPQYSPYFIHEVKTRYPDLPIGNIAKCITAVTADVHDCALDLVDSLLTLQVHKSPKCCQVVSDIDETCLRTVLNDLPFANVFSPFIEGLKYSIMNVVCP